MLSFLQRLQRGFKLAIIMAAPSALGFVVGSLIGQSGSELSINPTVLASVLPAVISAGGMVIFAGFGSRGKYDTQVQLSACVLLFSVAIFAGTIFGATIRTTDSRANFARALEYRLTLEDQLQQRRIRQIAECSRQEYFLNRGRAELGLEPIPREVVCPAQLLDNPASKPRN